MADITYGFKTLLHGQEIPSGECFWKLMSPLIYGRKDGSEIIIPVDFETDFYSVPDLLAGLVIDVDKRPAVLHDFLYRKGKINGLLISQKIADDLLLEAMIACKFSKWRRNVIYMGVRWFGSSTWNDYREQDGKEDGVLKTVCRRSSKIS